MSLEKMVNVRWALWAKVNILMERRWGKSDGHTTDMIWARTEHEVDIRWTSDGHQIGHEIDMIRHENGMT